jgi:hypothetical protein
MGFVTSHPSDEKMSDGWGTVLERGECLLIAKVPLFGAEGFAGVYSGGAGGGDG